MKVRTRTHHNGDKDVRAVVGSIIGENGMIPGVTLTFASTVDDDVQACRFRSNRADMVGNRVTVVRSTKVGSG